MAAAVAPIGLGSSYENPGAAALALVLGHPFKTLTPNPAALRATCAVCSRHLVLLRSGAITNHGPVVNPCAGSHQLPRGAVPVDDAQLGQSATSNQQLAELIGDPAIFLRKYRTTPLRFIPKAARPAFTTTATKVMTECITRGDLLSWLKLLMLPVVCLRSSKRTARSSSLASCVKERQLAFDKSTTISDLVAHTPQNKKMSTKGRRRTIEAMVSDKLDEGNVRAALRLTCGDATLAPFSNETFAVLTEKHPQSPSDRRVFPTTGRRDDLKASQWEVLTSVRSFPCGSAGGISMWRPQHLKDCLEAVSGDRGSPFLSALTKITNIILSGEVPRPLRPVMYGANLIALNKKGGGIRLIAAGAVFRRVAAKCAIIQVKQAVVALCSPMQLGCGIPGGIDAGIHASRALLQCGTADEIMLKIDFSNAFNCIRRDHLAECIAQHIPALSAFFTACYEDASYLTFGDHTISSAEGLQQGDPMAPLLFCLGIRGILTSLKSKATVAYLDDVTLFGNVDDVREDFARIRKESAAIGLSCNPSKCEVTPISGEAMEVCPGTELPGAVHVHLQDCTLLGAALGSRSMQAMLEKHTNQMRRFKQNLAELQAHDAFYLLKNCLSMPKLLFSLRTSPCFAYTDALTSLDNSLRETISSILNVVCNEAEWAQAALPAKMGGLGIPSPSSIASAAFLSSYHSSSHLAAAFTGAVESPPHVQEALSHWRMVSGQVQPPTSAHQSAWTTPVYRAQHDALLQSASTEQLARLHGCSAPGAAAWLSALPSSTLGLRLTSEQLRIAVCLRLGSRVYSQHACVCGSQADVYGQHSLSCGHMRARHSRHQQLNEIVSRALTASMVPNKLEPVGLLRDDNRRPDGITLVPWKRGCNLAWDASCVHRLARSWLPISSVKGTPAADQSEARKRVKYGDLGSHIIFEPVIVETLGGLSTTTVKFFHEVGRRLRSITGDPRAHQHLLQRIGIAVQRGNAGCVLESFTNVNTFNPIYS